MSIEIGQVIAQRYRVEAAIGKGGMAEVYKIWDSKRSVYLAMKVLNSDLAEDKIFMRRFKREADTLAKLSHPSIVRYYGLQEIGALAFILMDYVDGSTLRREIKETSGPFTPLRIIDIMRPVCAALEFAHHSNIVHCDLKPSNILEDRSGKVFLSDFGIARITDTTASSITLAGAGTPSYMAPEQIRGESPTAQMDIYAMGILLFELTTGGERPFIGEQATINGSTAERVRWEHLHTTAPSPRQYNPAIPPELEQIILRCLDKNPARRFQSTMELVNCLEHVLGWMVANKLDLNTARQYPTLPPQKLERKVKPWMWMTGAATLVILLTSTLAFGGGGPKTPSIAIDPVTDTPVPVLSGTIPLTPSPTYTLTPTPTVTTTVTRTTPPEIRACSANLACTQIGQTCKSPKDGMMLACVPAGTFTMGADEATTRRSFDVPDILRSMGGFFVHSVSLDAYWMDQTEVTNAMFAKFIAAIRYQTSAETAGRAYVFSYNFTNEKAFPYWKEVSGASWLHPFGPNSSLQAMDSQPVVSVSWLDAYQYCQWADRRLPSEAQWEKAARGNNSWFFPWGNQFPTTATKVANFADASLSTDFAETLLNDGYEYSAPVGSFPNGKSPYGVFDMAGNAMEWVEDAFNENSYQNKTNNPRFFGDPTSQMTERVIRGGSWETTLVRLRVSDRDNMIAVGRRADLGFRCAISTGN